MSFGISLVVLLAAMLHASWIALLRAGEDRLWSITVMCIAIAGICAMLAPFVPAPPQASWGYALLSALLHVGYNLFLLLGERLTSSRITACLVVAAGATCIGHGR